MNIEKLREQLNVIMPLLNKNLEITHDEWMKGNIPRGVYEYSLARHGNALYILNKDISVEKGLEVAATFLIDMRNHIDLDLNGNEKIDAQKILDNYIQFFQDNGFTEFDPIFEIPCKLI